MLQKVTWPIVALVTVVLTAVIVLASFHADTTVITNVLILLGLGAVGGGVVGVHNLVNGNTSKQLGMISNAMDKLAAAPPPEPPTVELSTVEEPTKVM